MLFTHAPKSFEEILGKTYRNIEKMFSKFLGNIVQNLGLQFEAVLPDDNGRNSLFQKLKIGINPCTRKSV